MNYWNFQRAYMPRGTHRDVEIHGKFVGNPLLENIGTFEACKSFWDPDLKLFIRTPPTEAYRCCRFACEQKQTEREKKICLDECDAQKKTFGQLPEYDVCLQKYGCGEQSLVNKNPHEIYEDFIKCLQKNKDSITSCCIEGCKDPDINCEAHCAASINIDLNPYSPTPAVDEIELTKAKLQKQKREKSLEEVQKTRQKQISVHIWKIAIFLGIIGVIILSGIGIILLRRK